MPRSAWKISTPTRRPFAEAGRADRHDHELLEVDVRVGVRAAVEDVHHRHRQQVAAWCCRRACRCARRAGLPTRAASALSAAIETPSSALAPSRLLVGVPSSANHRLVELALRELASAQRRGDLAVDMGDRLRDALAEVARLVAVAQLQRFALAGGRARRHGRAAARAAVEDDIDFHRRIAARVEDLARLAHRRIFIGQDTLIVTAIEALGSSAAIGFRFEPQRSSSIGPTNGSSSSVTTTMPSSVTVWRRRSSSALKPISAPRGMSTSRSMIARRIRAWRADAHAGHQDRLLDAAEAVDAHVGAEDAARDPAARDDAARRDQRVERLALAAVFGKHELRRRRLRLIGAQRPLRVVQVELRDSPGTGPCWLRSTRRACRCRASTSPPSCSRRRTGRRTPCRRRSGRDDVLAEVVVAVGPRRVLFERAHEHVDVEDVDAHRRQRQMRAARESTAGRPASPGSRSTRCASSTATMPKRRAVFDRHFDRRQGHRRAVSMCACSILR